MVPIEQGYEIRRSSKRNFLHGAADVRLAGVVGVHVAVVRDLSETGMFLYSDFKPLLGTNLQITVKPSFFGCIDAGFYCEGAVVRVEQQRAGAAPGIAVRLTHKLAMSYIAHLENVQPQHSLNA